MTGNPTAGDQTERVEQAARARLQEQLQELAWVEARRRMGLGDRPPYAPGDGSPEQQRASWLAMLAACELLREELKDWATVAAHAAARVGADYGDLGDAVSITRQAARKRWPGLADTAKAARGRENAEPNP
ncbi:hypothetical protein ACQEVZ_60730 [Dactylosporangium sp. CA-152071]|uniref:hypothetical protein n=1 Tax=Dactylosporangium sp. CA-152071 TaxID=3239933 RepID=UPI003D94CE08